MKTETKQKTKKVLGIVLNVLIWVFVVFSCLVTILVFAAQGNKDGVPQLFGKSMLTIESPSMEPVYGRGDLVFMEKLSDEEKRELQAGEIITYYAPIDINGDGKVGDLNTHRIETHNTETGVITTKGDNNLAVDGYTISYNDIVGRCTEKGKIGGIGNVIKFLRSSLGFFLCVLLPMFLFFLYELYNFISLLVSRKQKATATISKETEEEIKRRAVEEYLKSQGITAPQAAAPEGEPEAASDGEEGDNPQG